MISLASVIPWCKDKFQKAMDAFGGCFEEKGILTSIVGPFILGMGMTLSGAVSNNNNYYMALIKRRKSSNSTVQMRCTLLLPLTQICFGSAYISTPR
jgi:hypothetical protein